MTESPNTDPDWTTEVRAQTGAFNEAGGKGRCTAKERQVEYKGAMNFRTEREIGKTKKTREE